MATRMYLTMSRLCPLDAYFNVPHKDEPMTAKQIAKRLPNFAAIFDGECIENTLSIYYKKSKMTDIYEFIDEEAELEVAELMGVKVKVFKDKEEEELGQQALNKEQLVEFRHHMNDIKVGIDWLNKRKEDGIEIESEEESAAELNHT